MNEFSKIITEETNRLRERIDFIQARLNYFTGRNTGTTDEKEKQINNIFIEYAKKELDKTGESHYPKKGELKWD